MRTLFAMASQAVINRPTKRSPTNRSRVTNGRRAFVDGDGRGQWARRHHDLVELHLADLGQVEGLSEAQHSLCRRAATLEVQLEALEGQLSKGEGVDLDVYARVTGHLRRVLETLGIKRAIKTINNPLVDHFSRPPAPREAA